MIQLSVISVESEVLHICGMSNDRFSLRPMSQHHLISTNECPVTGSVRSVSPCYVISVYLPSSRQVWLHPVADIQLEIQTSTWQDILKHSNYLAGLVRWVLIFQDTTKTCCFFPHLESNHAYHCAHHQWTRLPLLCYLPIDCRPDRANRY